MSSYFTGSRWLGGDSVGRVNNSTVVAGRSSTRHIRADRGDNVWCVIISVQISQDNIQYFHVSGILGNNLAQGRIYLQKSGNLNTIPVTRYDHPCTGVGDQ